MTYQSNCCSLLFANHISGTLFTLRKWQYETTQAMLIVVKNNRFQYAVHNN